MLQTGNQLGTRRTDGRGVSVIFSTRQDFCASTILAWNIRVLLFHPIFVNVSGDLAMLSRTDLVTWVLGAVAKPIETRVPKLLEKEQRDLASSAWH